MSKSRARLLAELLNSAGRVKKDKSDLAGDDSIIDLDTLPTITNAKLENSSISVAGHSVSLGGTVTLDTADITEHTDYPYFTNARARAAISVDGSLSYNSSTGVLSYTTPTTIASLSNHDTDDLAEGTNLYFTNARARGAISVSGSTISYNSTTGVITSTANNYVLPTATSSAIGGVKIGYSENGKNYPVELSSGQMFVNVPWTDTDTNTTYSALSGGGLALSSTSFKLNGSEIAGSVDLDTMRTTGIFPQNANADAVSGSNYPEDLAGILEVINPNQFAGGNNLHTLQRYSIYNSTKVWHRYYYNGTWSSWRDLSADTNTTYSVGDGGLTQKNFTTTLKSKLDGIAASANNYVLPFTDNSANWNTAYGWGNHASAGYLTSHQSLAAYAPLASPALTGTPTAPTASAGTNTTQIATTAFVGTAVSNLVDSAPGTLNTLNELAAALGDDANFSTTVTNSIATKLPKAGGTMAGSIAMANYNITGVNQLEFNDPGEGIVFKQGSSGDMVLKIIDDTSDNILQYSGTSAVFDVQGNITLTGTVTASGGNSGNWNTAYGWGNHASAGYLTAVPSKASPLTSTELGAVDLDDYAQADDAGFYHQTANADATNGDNWPIGRAGSLLVQKGANTGGYGTTQLFIDYDSSDVYVRSMYNTGAANRSWVKLYDTSDFTNNSTNWNTAYGWGNHASAGYVVGNTSNAVNLTITGTISSGAITSSSTIQGTAYKVGSTVIVNTNRDLTNIGTISSGNITTSGVLQVNVGTASHTRFRITRPNSTTAALYMGVDSSNNAMMAANNSALRIGKDVAGTFYEYLTVESGGNTNVKNELEINGTTVISSTRRLTPTGIQMSPDTGLYATDATLSYYSSSNAVYLNGAGPNGWLRLNAAGSQNDTNAINIFGSNAGANITFKTAGTQRMNIDSSGNLRWGSANTAILDPSRNLTNIGTISSGGITSSGILTINSTGSSNAIVAKTGSLINFQVETYTTQTTLRSDSTDFYIWQPNSGYQFRATNNGAVYLSYDGSTKLTTQTGGISITGTTNSTTGYQVNGTAVIDSSRNITAGTISSGAITSSSNIKSDKYFISANGQQLILAAGESAAQLDGVTGGNPLTNESVYAVAEGGLQVISSPDNWIDSGSTYYNDSSWAKRKVTTINDSSGNSTFAGTISSGAITSSGNITLAEYLYHNGDTDTNLRFQTNRATLTSGGGAIVDAHSNGNLYLTGTTLQVYGNYSSTGTISSGAITSSGNIQHTGLTMTSGTDVDQLYSATQSLTVGTSWMDTGINGNELTSGTYIVQLYVNNFSVGGEHYQEYYSGVMSWTSANSNSGVSDELVLHRAGHAPNAGIIYLRTLRTYSADTDDLKLQIRSSVSTTGNSNYVFKFRRMI